MKKTIKIIAIASIMLIALSAGAYAVLPDKRGPTEVDAAENNPEMIELFRVRFENKLGGKVETTLDAGAAGWRQLGKVLLPAGNVAGKGYTASSWAPEGCIAATAVNAIHVKVRLEEGRGVTLSFLPKELYEEPKNYNSYYARSASIVTDIPSGTLFFGGRESPLIGNKILVSRGGGEAAPMAKDYKPAEGDTLTVVVERPKRYPAEIEFENRFGGFVTLRYPDGESKVIAQVLKPVAGVGRFGGSMYADVGRIRANHTGVICISTSPLGVIGGFQILPDNHGMSEEMFNARLLTQWMVIGPTSVFDPSLEGVAPFFRYFIRPVYIEEGPAGRTIGEMMQQFIVQVRIKNGDWERMPTAAGRVDDALKDVTHVRILFPLEWLKD
ncbi:MAG: hypothetical protein WCX65_15245 [bacterium]